jgi:hypothetical protein
MRTFDQNRYTFVIIGERDRLGNFRLTWISAVDNVCAMPTVLRVGPYRFHFYSRESNEPPHIHVARDDMEAKFWLRPVSPASNLGFSGTRFERLNGWLNNIATLC